MEPCPASVVALNGRIALSRSSFTLAGTLTGVILATPVPSEVPCLCVWAPDGHVQGHLRCFESRFSFPRLLVWRVRSPGVPPEPLDAFEDLPKEAPGQVALGHLEHEVARMSDQPPAGLEEPLLEAR